MEFLIYLSLFPFLKASYFCEFDCNGEHTVCKYEPCTLLRRCGSAFTTYEMSDELRDFIVSWQNKLRSSIAVMGVTSFVNKDKNKTEPVSDMQILNYNKELEFVAKCWAYSCPIERLHDVCRSTSEFKDVGQNVFIKYNVGPDVDMKKLFIEALSAWKEELKLLTPSVIMSYIRDEKTANGTQMIWAETIAVGCGIAKFGVEILFKVHVVIVCNYGPEGALSGKPVYEPGEPCSKCNICDSKYNLCGIYLEHRDDLWLPPFIMGTPGKNFNFILIIISLSSSLLLTI